MASCIKFGVEGVGQALSFVDASGSGPQPLICPVAHKEMRGVSSWVLGATAVAMALMVATTSAGDLEDDIEGLWESTGGDIMRKLVTDMENDAVAAGRKMVRAAASMGGSYRRSERCGGCAGAPRAPLVNLQTFGIASRGITS